MAEFEQAFTRALLPILPRRLRRGECQTPSGRPCTLCAAHRVEYNEECRIRDRVLHDYWKAHEANFPIEPLVASPKGREYRTVTKRKVFPSRGKIELGLIGVDDETSSIHPVPVVQCMIEPPMHAEIYRCVQDFVNQKEQKDAARILNYVIVKGTYESFVVLFNVVSFNQVSRKFIIQLSKHLTKAVPAVKGVFVYLDERRSRYYLSRTRHRPKAQRIFGDDAIALRMGTASLFYSPLSFSQTNLSMVDRLVSAAKEMLALSPSDRLVDLYCGYGLFSLSMAALMKNAVGVDISAESIRDAQKNAQRLRSSNCSYILSDINEETLGRIFSSHGNVTKAILDPPRNGIKRGVIETIAAAGIRRAVHIFCNLEIVKAELQRWRNSRYEVRRALPFDMFPGTRETELMVLLEKL